VDLIELQTRLSQQYASLRDLRTIENYSVYAIEHGLTAEELVAAQALLNTQLETAMRADSAHWLVWIAAAAEVGYGYDGTEYWDSFVAAFPPWQQHGDRNQIRKWYLRFASEFRGLTPSGLWARQFPIIAWPITQAVLPRYLQRHFAEHLYQLRHALVRTGELTLDEIGDLLSERYYGGSSRFEGFLQQKALTARILMAMGLEDVADNVAPIERATLDRLVRDFDKLGGTGARLREARRVLRDARFINSSKTGFVPTARNQEQSAADAERAEKPRLVAHPVGEHAWSLSLALPDLATPLRQAGLSPRDLEQARMRFRVNGEGNEWIPGRALFGYVGQSEDPLGAYPAAEWQVFEFQLALPKAEGALRKRLVFPAQPLRLLKVRTDGSAFEVVGQHVRAKQSYLFVSVHTIPNDIVQTLGLSPAPTSTSGTSVWHLQVPQNVSAAQIAALKNLGLGYALSVRLEPMGLSPRWNPATGALQFLDTEVPMFALNSDIAVREFAFSVDSSPPVRIKPSVDGKTLVRLDQLGVGLHKVAVSALGAATGADIEAEDIALEVRPPAPWQKAIGGKAGVTFALEPRDATLEQLFDRIAIIRVRAPHGRSVHIEARFLGADNMPFHQEALLQYTMPIADQRITDHVIRKLTADARAEHLERASRIELTILLDEYGSETIGFERDVEPLRWARMDAKIVRLSDDSAGEIAPTVECYDLNAVEVARAVDYQSALAGVELSGKGGLLVAKLDGRHYVALATVVPSQLSSLSDIGVPARVSAAKTGPKKIINALKLWRSTRRLMGPMAFVGRLKAIGALEKRLELLLCGAEWASAAATMREGSGDIGSLYQLVFYSRGFASGLRTFEWRYEKNESGATAEFLRLTRVYKVCDNERLCCLALKLAFRPSFISPSDLPDEGAFDALKATPGLIRGAYFARLVSDMQAQSAAQVAT
jgi:hypothetical protein